MLMEEIEAIYVATIIFNRLSAKKSADTLRSQHPFHGAALLLPRTAGMWYNYSSCECATAGHKWRAIAKIQLRRYENDMFWKNDPN